MGLKSSFKETMHVVPGEPSFLSIPIRNSFKIPVKLTVKVSDPDESLGIKEFSLISDPAEVAYWERLGRVLYKKSSLSAVTKAGEVFLQPGEQTVVLCKFLTFRDC